MKSVCIRRPAESSGYSRPRVERDALDRRQLGENLRLRPPARGPRGSRRRRRIRGRGRLRRPSSAAAPRGSATRSVSSSSVSAAKSKSSPRRRISAVRSSGIERLEQVAEVGFVQVADRAPGALAASPASIAARTASTKAVGRGRRARHGRGGCRRSARPAAVGHGGSRPPRRSSGSRLGLAGIRPGSAAWPSRHGLSHKRKSAARGRRFALSVSDIGAVEKTRTSTGCPTATSTLRVYQFRHDRMKSPAPCSKSVPATQEGLDAGRAREPPAALRHGRSPGSCARGAALGFRRIREIAAPMVITRVGYR